MVGVNNPGNQQAEGQSSAEGSVTSLVDNKVTLLYFHGKIFTNFTPFLSPQTLLHEICNVCSWLPLGEL